MSAQHPSRKRVPVILFSIRKYPDVTGNENQIESQRYPPSPTARPNVAQLAKKILKPESGRLKPNEQRRVVIRKLAIIIRFPSPIATAVKLTQRLDPKNRSVNPLPKQHLQITPRRGDPARRTSR